MVETRDFSTAVMASLTSGTVLCDGGFSKMHEAAEFLMGHPIWTHQFASEELRRYMQKTALEQCPGLPTEAPGVTAANYREFVAKLEGDLGKTVKIRKGSGLTALLPTDGIPDHLKDKTIILKI